MRYNFYFIIFTPAPGVVMDIVIMARNKKEAIRKLVGEDEDIILRIFRMNENPLIIGREDILEG